MVTPDEAIVAIRDAGGTRPGHRALHAKGKLFVRYQLIPGAGEPFLSLPVDITPG